MMKLREKGFTLVEIMIVVAIIGLLAAIAVPNFMRAREKAQTEACIANLKQIEGAIQVWAVDLGKSDTDAVAMTDLVNNYLKSTPHCPANANSNYTLTYVNTRPTCPVNTTTHVLP
jgi:type II secretion system protein G